MTLKTPSGSWSQRAASVADGLEKGTLTLLILFLLGFALLQIVLRNFFATGIVWADTVLRHVLLWASLLGMARAVGERKYIAIELFPVFLSGRGRQISRAACDAFSCLVSAVLCVISWQFVRNERAAGDLAFLNVPVWWLEVIFPVAFALMTLRFACNLRDSAFQHPESDAS